jgi:hypothetical protein
MFLQHVNSKQQLAWSQQTSELLSIDIVTITKTQKRSKVVYTNSCDMIYVNLLCVYITKEQAPESSTAVASALLPYVS